MRIISTERCNIGEGPIWNEQDKKLWQVNPRASEIFKIDLKTLELEKIKCPIKASAIAFDTDFEPLISTPEGVFRFKSLTELEPIYDREKYLLRFCNDMKVGPDGRLYVGTRSGKRVGASDKIDGKLYRVEPNGEVKILLDGLILSNGLDWSCDGRKFYHTDSDTGYIREYDFEDGEIFFTGREVRVAGVDGFTVDRNDRIIAACWGHSQLAVVDTRVMMLVDYVEVPAKIPASCAFAGEEMNFLAVVTASFGTDIDIDKYAGFTFLEQSEIGGNKPYLFGEK